MGGNVWSQSQLKDHIMQHYGEDIWEHTILDGIRGIIWNTMEAASYSVTNRQNSFELYGVDIMLDGKCKPWLLEVNLSPALHNRTPFLHE